MTIETKYNIGEKAFWVGYGGDWCEGKIRGIMFIDDKVLYLMEECTIKDKIYAVYVEEYDLFPTKEELLKSL